MSTHNICFRGEIKISAILDETNALSVAMTKVSSGHLLSTETLYII